MRLNLFGTSCRASWISWSQELSIKVMNILHFSHPSSRLFLWYPLFYYSRFMSEEREKKKKKTGSRGSKLQKGKEKYLKRCQAKWENMQSELQKKGSLLQFFIINTEKRKWWTWQSALQGCSWPKALVLIKLLHWLLHNQWDHAHEASMGISFLFPQH